MVGVVRGGLTVWIWVWPMGASVSEKFEAFFYLALCNSRLKDFSVIWSLSRSIRFEGAALVGALLATFARRNTPLPAEAPIALTSSFHGDQDHQRQWDAFAARIGEPALIGCLPTVVADVARFTMPACVAALNRSSPGSWLPRGPWRPD